MSTEENKDNEIPPFPKPKEGYVPLVEKEEEKKKSNGMGWLSVLVSIFFIIRGVMWIGDDMPVFGLLMIALGVGGGIWKIIDMSR
jgi:hypothetical protein